MRISDWSSDVCSSDLLDFAVIGRVTDTGHMVLRHKGEIVCDIPLGPLADNAPKYDRPHVPTPKRAPLGEVPAKGGVDDNLVAMMGSPDLASRRWVWEQYDHMVGADRSEEHTSELKSLMRNSYAVFCLKKKTYS